MGWKGPAIIFIFGVLGLGALAMFANVLLESPEARNLLELGEQLAANAPLEHSTVSTVEGEHLLKLFARPGSFREPAKGELPAGFEKVPSVYRRHRLPGGPRQFLRLEILEGDPDGDARLLWSTRLDLYARDEEIRTQLSELLGQKIKINPRPGDGGMGLGVGLRRKVAPEDIDRAAAILAGYRYGGWELLSFNLGGRGWQYYDSEGKRIDKEQRKVESASSPEKPASRMP